MLASNMISGSGPKPWNPYEPPRSLMGLHKTRIKNFPISYYKTIPSPALRMEATRYRGMFVDHVVLNTPFWKMYAGVTAGLLAAEATLFHSLAHYTSPMVGHLLDFVAVGAAAFALIQLPHALRSVAEGLSQKAPENSVYMGNFAESTKGTILNRLFKKPVEVIAKLSDFRKVESDHVLLDSVKIKDMTVVGERSFLERKVFSGALYRIVIMDRTAPIKVYHYASKPLTAERLEALVGREVSMALSRKRRWVVDWIGVQDPNADDLNLERGLL